MLTSRKLCNSWTIPVTACYRPAPQPGQSCCLPSPRLGGQCSTIPLAQHWMATTLVQRCLTVIREVKTKYQMQEHPRLPFPLSGLVPSATCCTLHRQQQRWRAADEHERRGPVSQMSPQSPGPALWSFLRAPGCAACRRDAANTRLGSTAAGAKRVKDKKAVVLPRIIIREHSRVRRQGIGKCYDNKETPEEGGEIFTMWDQINDLYNGCSKNSSIQMLQHL